MFTPGQPMEPSPLSWRRLAGGICVLGSSQFVFLVCNTLIQMIAIRQLSQANYGWFALLNLVSLFFLVFLSAGLPQALRYLVCILPARVARAFRCCAFWHLPLSVAVALLFVLLAGPLAVGQENPDSKLLTWLLALEIVLRAGILEPCLYLLNGLACYGLQSRIQIFYSIARLVGVVLLLPVGGLAGGVCGLAGAAFLACLPACWSLYHWPRDPVYQQDPTFYVELKRLLLRSSGYGLLCFLLAGSNLWLVKWWVADPTATGIYAAAFMMTRPLSLIGMVLASGMFAHLATTYAQGHRSHSRNLVMGSFRLLLLLFVPAGILGFRYGGDLIMAIGGPRYRGCSDYLGILVVGSCCLAIQDYCGEMLGALGRYGMRSLITGGMIVVNLVATGWLVARTGIMGAAIAQLLTGIVSSLVTLYLLSLILGPLKIMANLLEAGAATLPLLLFSWIVPVPAQLPYEFLHLLGACLIYGGTIYGLNKLDSLSGWIKSRAIPKE